MKTTKKFKLTDDTIVIDGITLHRIKALKDFSDVKSGDFGGWIEKEENLSQIDDAWIDDNAKVYGNAYVFGNALIFGAAMIYGHARIYGCARIYGNSLVCGDAEVCGNAEVYGYSRIYDDANVHGDSKIHGLSKVCGNANIHGTAEISDGARCSGYAEICGDAKVCDDADYIVFKNFWSSGRHFTWTRSNNMWKVGCFYGTGKELIEKAYKDSERSGKEYERVVRYVNSILADE